MRLVSADQEAPCTRLQQWVLGLQVRLVFEQLCDIEADTVFGLAPGDCNRWRTQPGWRHPLACCSICLSSASRFSLSAIDWRTAFSST